MQTVTLDGYEFPANPPPRPRGMNDTKALARMVGCLEVARSLCGFHERGLYKALSRTQAMVMARLDAAREADGSGLQLAENKLSWPGE